MCKHSHNNLYCFFYLLLLLIVINIIIIVIQYCILITSWFGVSLVCFPALIIHGVQTKFQFNPRTDFICNMYKLIVEAYVAYVPRTGDLEVWVVALFP